MKRIIFCLLAFISLLPAAAQTAKEQQEAWQEQFKLDCQANKGYVWTININGATVIDVAELVTCYYSLGLSMSHVGENPTGVYSGEMKMANGADLSKMQALLNAIGGSIKADDQFHFGIDPFVMHLIVPDNAKMLDWEKRYGRDAVYNGLSADEKKLMRMVYEDIMGDIPQRHEKFEDGKPLAIGYGTTFIPTSGSLDQHGRIDIAGFWGYGTSSGNGTIQKDGSQKVGGNGKVVSIMGVNDVKFGETIKDPFPHTLTIYPDGKAVMEIRSPKGGPMVIKFYGTIDKIPVEQTVQATADAMRRSHKSTTTDVSVEAQMKAAKAAAAAAKTTLVAEIFPALPEGVSDIETGKKDYKDKSYGTKNIGPIYYSSENEFSYNQMSFKCNKTQLTKFTIAMRKMGYKGGRVSDNYAYYGNNGWFVWMEVRKYGFDGGPDYYVVCTATRDVPKATKSVSGYPLPQNVAPVTEYKGGVQLSGGGDEMLFFEMDKNNLAQVLKEHKYHSLVFDYYGYTQDDLRQQTQALKDNGWKLLWESDEDNYRAMLEKDGIYCMIYTDGAFRVGFGASQEVLDY